MKWQEFIFEFFGRRGYFSLRPMPLNEAERQERAAVERRERQGKFKAAETIQTKLSGGSSRPT